MQTDTATRFDPPSERQFWRLVIAVTVAGLLALIALEATTIDMALARWSYDAASGGFALREHWLTTRVGHEGIKTLSVLAFAGLLVSIWRPFGPLRRLPCRARVLLLLSVVACLLIVSALKRGSALHCPWDLSEFGGAHAYLRLLESTPTGWPRGACFPAGHALSAFAYIGGYFAWRPLSRRAANAWLAAVLLLGAGAGISQQLRGAHFLSHTLWTLWLCWTLSAFIAWLDRTRRGLRGVKPADDARA